MDESKRSPEEILKEAYARLFFKYTVLHPNKPLTKDGVLALVNLMGWDTQNAPVELEESYVKTIENKDLKEMYELLMRSLGARIIYGRLKAIDMKISIPAILWLSTFIKSPGEAVMYAHYIAYKFKRRNLGMMIKLDDLAQHCFPWGIFREDQLGEIWATNKIPLSPDNLLDYPMAWEFIGL